MNIKETLKKQEDKKELNNIAAMKHFINMVCNKEFGDKPKKYMYKKVSKTLLIYFNEKKFSLTLDEYKDKSKTDDQMYVYIKELLTA